MKYKVRINVDRDGVEYWLVYYVNESGNDRIVARCLDKDWADKIVVCLNR